MSGLNNKRYLDGDGLLKFWEICCANFPHKDGRGATGDWNIKAATAGTADEAIKLKAERKITITGAVTSTDDVYFDGSKDITISTSVNHTHNKLHQKYTQATRPASANVTVTGDGTLSHFKATSVMTTGKPVDVGHVLHFEWDNAGGYSSQLYIPVKSGANVSVFPQWRTTKSGNTTEWHDWDTFLTTGNYSTYALPISGGTLTGNLIAPKFIGELQGNVTGNVSGSSGSCTGNAATASNATKSESLAGGHGVSNAANYSITYLAGGFTNNTTPTANQVYLGTSPEWNVISSPRYDGTDAVQNIMSLRLGWNSSYWHEIATGPNVNNSLYHRSINYKNAKDWALLLDSSNYSTYALPLSGGTLTGNLTAPAFIGALQGNAATASSAAKLTAPIAIWGQSFDGSKNITGDMSGVGKFSASDNGYVTDISNGNITISIPATVTGGWARGLSYKHLSNENSFGQLAGAYGEGSTLGYFYYGGGHSIGQHAMRLYDANHNYNAVFTGNVTAAGFTGNLSGIASKVSVGTGSGSTYRAIVVTDGSNGLYTAGTATGKPQYNYSTGDVKAKSFTTDGGNFIGNLNGNATSADKLNTNAGSATKPIYFGEGIPKQCNDTLDVSITGDADHATTAGTAGKTVGTLTLKTPAETKTFNGSTDVTFEVTPAKLGLTKAVLYLGKSTTAITDGGTEKPTIDGTQITALTAGNIVIDSADSREYIWNGSKWEKFGLDGDGAAGNYKPIQAVVGDPTASGNSTTFIDTIAQDANGKITATKKNVNFSGYATTAQLSNYLPKTGGTLATTASTILSLNNTNSTNNEVGLRLDMNSSPKGWVGYTSNTGTYLYTYTGPHKLGIKEDGTGFIDGNTIIHSGNIGSQSVASATNATNASKIHISNSAVSSDFPVTFVSNTTIGNQSLVVSSGKSLTFNPSTGNLKATTFTGNVTGNVSGSSGSCTGNAATATVLKTTRKIWGQNFNGEADISGDLSILYGDTDKFVMWDYDGDGGAGASWRIGAKGTGSSNTNYFTIQSGTSTTTATTWTDVLNIGQNDFTVYFTNTPCVGSTKVSLEGHTHNYAGSSTAGGAATKVVCSAATSDTNRPILVTNESNGLCYTTKVKLNYSTGIITATNFITTSDRRMKDNITEIVDASKSLELGFYEFDYKSGGHSAGHVAQEVREVLPEFVHGEETETTHLSVDYTGLHSVQIKALKDEVDTLKTENKELRERLEKLEALLEKLV